VLLRVKWGATNKVCTRAHMHTHSRLPTPTHARHHALLRRWRSFYRGGSVALYISVYALGFLLSR